MHIILNNGIGRIPAVVNIKPARLPGQQGAAGNLGFLMKSYKSLARIFVIICYLNSTMDHSVSQSLQFQPSAKQTISISRSDRWQAYYRLQELDISCECLADGRFQVDISSPIAALQLWSVLKHLTEPRQHLATWLERCWELD